MHRLRVFARLLNTVEFRHMHTYEFTNDQRSEQLRKVNGSFQATQSKYTTTTAACKA